MIRRSWLVCLSGLLTVAVLGLGTSAEAARKAPKKKKPVVNVSSSKADPKAPSLELFEGMKSGDLETKVVAQDPFNAKVLIENKTDAPLNVVFPKAVVAANVLPQFGGGMGGGGMGGGMGGMGGGMGGMGGGMGGMGGGQMMGGGMGGGMGGMGGGMGGMGGGGMGGGGMGGMFSVPPEKIVSVPLNTVCLEHGKDDPNLSMQYQLFPVSAVSKDPLLTEFLSVVGSGKVDQQSAQAAAWHLANNLSWQQLASKTQGGEGSSEYFTQEELVGAQQLLTLARQRMAQNADENDSSKPEADPKATPPKRDRVSKLTN